MSFPRSPHALFTSVAVGAAAFLLLGGGSAAAAAVTCHGERATVVGTSAPDNLGPSDLASGDVVATRGGNDSVEVDGVKNVRICGGPGYDHVDVSSGTKTSGIVFFGGDRRDTFSASDHTKHPVKVYGENGPDFLYGGAGDDMIDGGAGDDYIRAKAGKDRVKAQGGNDWVQGGTAFDTMFGGGGNDSLFGLEFDVPPRKDKADMGDGGKGRDYCQTTERHSCERKQRTDIPL